jgi:hypothetical protein
MRIARGRMEGERPPATRDLKQFTCYRPLKPEVVDLPTVDLRSEVRGLPVSF